jgi:hypothetical protein
MTQHTNGAVPDLDIDAIIDAAQLAERTLALCLRGDLQARFEELEREFEAANEARGDSVASGATSLASGGRARELAEEMEALRVQMRASTITVVLRAMPRKKWQALCEQHPPRQDDDGKLLVEDRASGVNNDTFWEPAIRGCWVSPVLTPARMKRLLDEALSNRQYDLLATAVYAVNNSDVDIPFSPAASRLIRSSEPE